MSKRKKYILAVIIVITVIASSLLINKNGNKGSPKTNSSNIVNDTNIEEDKYNAFVNEAKEATKDLEDKIKNKVNTEESISSNISHNSKEFNNELLKFDYPNYWLELENFKTKETSSNVKNVIMVGNTNQAINDIENFRITIEELKGGISGKEYAEETEKVLEHVFKDHYYTAVVNEKINISGRESILKIYRWLPEDEEERTPYEQERVYIKQAQTYVAKNNKIYIFTFTTSENNFNEFYKDKITKIIDSIEVK